MGEDNEKIAALSSGEGPLEGLAVLGADGQLLEQNGASAKVQLSREAEAFMEKVATFRAR